MIHQYPYAINKQSTIWPFVNKNFILLSSLVRDTISTKWQYLYSRGLIQNPLSFTNVISTIDSLNTKNVCFVCWMGHSVFENNWSVYKTRTSKPEYFPSCDRCYLLRYYPWYFLRSTIIWLMAELLFPASQFSRV